MDHWWAKQRLEDFIGVIDKKLDNYWQEEIKVNFGFNRRQKDLVRKILEHAKDHNLRPAKRLRASFVYYAYALGNNVVDERTYKAAMAVELVHTALLMHDDFMDQDDVRRGKPTTHKYFEDGDVHYGEAMAVDVGDAVLLLGYQLLNDSGYEPEKVILAERQLLRGVVNTAYGQAYDIGLGKYKNWGEEDVIVLHRAKTAIYTYKNPLFIGAMLAGLEGEVFDVLDEYSMNGGVAFQLQDDVLGVYGDTEKTGKSANSDLLQGKVTLLILKALEMGTDEQKGAVKKVWGKRRANAGDIEEAKKAIKESGSYEYSMDISREYARKAVETAEKLRGLNLNREAIDYIQGIAEYMVHREV